MTETEYKAARGKQFEDFGKQTIFKHTCQIITTEDLKNFRPLAAGVLVQIKNIYLLITAAHVAEESRKSGIYIPTPQGKISVNGFYFEADIPQDKIDSAYVLLDPEIVQELKLFYSFLTEDKIVENLIHDDIYSYFTLGYPTENIWNENGKIVTGSSAYILPHSKPKVYDYYKYNPETHFVLDFSGVGKDLITSKKRDISTEPYGMSGSGLWLVSISGSLEAPVFDYWLIGIMTQFKKGKYLVLIGNRIDLVMRDIYSNINNNEID